jgi:hypothetical protein
MGNALTVLGMEPWDILRFGLAKAVMGVKSAAMRNREIERGANVEAI